MAIESTSAARSTFDQEASIIENEIPTYRAISARAVTSLVLGLVSVFCFTSPWFWLVVVASVLFGWSAIQTIRRMPDILTGAGLAKTGIGLALVFGLTATTRTVVEDLMLNYEATQFAKMYVDVLKNEPVALAAWYRQAPDFRKEKSPEALVAELKTSKNRSIPDVYAAETVAIQAIKDLLAKPNEDIHFSKIERKLVDGLTHYANALLDIDGPNGEEEFALLEMMKAPGGGRGDWRVRDIRFPYKPASIGLMTEKKDDGHGHGH